MESSNGTLPPGFRFHPTDEELIVHYLNKKASSTEDVISSLIADVDLYKFNPWDLPDMAIFGEDEWFFFSPRDRKYPNGSRPNRAAASGFWKATSTDKPILSSRGSGSLCIGVKKALVFCQGRPPKGSKTNWMMYEYRLLNRSCQTPGLTGSMRLDDWVLCRVYQKSETTSKQCHKSSSSTLPRYVLKGSERKNIMENTSYSKHYRILPKEINNQLGSAQLLAQLLVEPKEVTSNEIADDIGFVDFLEENGECYMSEEITEPQTDMQEFFITDALATIRRVLSVGALDEQLTSIPDMSLSSYTSSNMV